MRQRALPAMPAAPLRLSNQRHKLRDQLPLKPSQSPVGGPAEGSKEE